MRVGQARKRDANEPPIVQALEQVGVLVRRLSAEGLPDLLTCRRGVLRLVEVKTARGRSTPAQRETLQQGWPVVIVRSVEEALAVHGVGWSPGGNRV